MVTRLGLGDEDDEAFHAGDTVAFAAGLFDVNLVLFALFNWLVEGSATGLSSDINRFTSRQSRSTLGQGKGALAYTHTRYG